MRTRKTELRTTDNKFRSVYATERIRQGDMIVELPVTTQPDRDRYSIEAMPGIHIDCSFSLVGAINHSCNPNAAVRNMKIVAWSCIEPGDEISIDYRRTEEHLYEPFLCNCCGEKMEW